MMSHVGREADGAGLMVYTAFESECIALPLLLFATVRVGEGTKGLGPSAYLPKCRGTSVNSQTPRECLRQGRGRRSLHSTVATEASKLRAEHRASMAN